MLAGCTPWPDELALTYRAKGYWENISIPHLFETMVTEAPDRVAVVEGDQRATLADLWAESGRFAAHFDRLGLAKGQRVVFQLPNAKVFFSAFLGLLRIGDQCSPHQKSRYTYLQLEPNLSRFGNHPDLGS